MRTSQRRFNWFVGVWFIIAVIVLYAPETQASGDRRYNEANAHADATAEGGDAYAEGGAGGTSNASITGIRQVPGMGTASIYSSHSCVMGKSAVLALKDVGIGGGGQKVDPDCADREWSRIMYAMGMVDQARELACMSPSGQKLKSCDYTSSDYDVYLESDLFDNPDRLMADVTQEEYEAQQKLIEDKFAQYDEQIQAQQEEIEYQREEIASHSDDEDLEYLKMLAAEQRAAEQKRFDADAARRAATRAILAKEKEVE